MNISELRESVLAKFIDAIEEAGFVDPDSGDDVRPNYYRSYIPIGEVNNEKPAWLLYSMQDTQGEFADNDYAIVNIYISGRIMTRNTFNDADFQMYRKAFENSLKENGFKVEFTSEYVDTNLSPDVPIYATNYDIMYTI